MPMLLLALLTGAMTFLYVSWASWVGGFPPEIALFRGVLGFMAISVLGFVAELTVATIRPGASEQRRSGREPLPLRPRAAAPESGSSTGDDEAQRAA